MPIRMTGLASGLNTESIIGALMSAQRMKQTKVENKKTKLEWKQEKWSGLNTKIYDFYKGSLAKMKSQASYKTKAVASSDSSKVTATASSKVATGTYSIKVKELATAQYVTGAKLSSKATATTKLVDLAGSSFKAGTVIDITSGKGDDAKKVAFTVTESSTIGDFTKACSDAGLSATFDTTQQRMFIGAKDSGADNVFTITTNGSSTSALTSLGLDDIKADASGNVSATTGDDKGKTSMVVIAAKDSVIEYNGVEMTSSSTSMTIAGLQLNLLGTTGDNTINITVTNDIDSTYDAIKNMISDYNAVLKEMNTNYNAESARNYDVLSDDEKEAMSDDEVEKWEKKIKDSLLRRDTTLGGIISSFRNNMVKSYTTSSGKKYSLASLGITTSAKDYKEGGLLHIKGDEDDAEYAESTNTLKKMLAEDPDAVMETMTGILTGLYEDLQKKMKSTTMSSALTFYNDKEMASQLSDYKKQISTWESKLSEMEDRYYKQFAAMEKSLSDMQSQQNSLASYLS